MTSTPMAPRRPHPITQHGQTRNDDYYWLRDRDDPATLEYLKAENDYLDEMMHHTLTVQGKLFEELKARIKEDDSSVPERKGEYYTYRRDEAGKQYPLYCRKRGSLDAPEEVILDQNALAEGKDFCRIGAMAISPDDNKLAYSIDPDGTENCLISIKNLSTGKLYPESIPNTYANPYLRNGLAWANDNQTLFYVIRDEAWRPYKLYRHKIGDDPANDQLVYHEADETFFLFLGKSRSGAYVEIHCVSTDTHEWRILNADQPDGEFQVFQARTAGLEYQIEHSGDRFLIVTNLDATNFRLMETPVSATGKDNWKEVIPHRSDVLVEAVAAFEDYLVVQERKEGLKQLRISPINDVAKASYVPFPEAVYNIALADNPSPDSTLVRFTYSSLITPDSVIDYHMDSGQWELKKQIEIPSGHDTTQYVTERLQATAPDGKRVPMSVVYRKDLKKDGQNPTLLYGYGSYGMSIDPFFVANRFSLIDRGFVFAIGHIRGGSDLGRAWYEDGKMLNKRNTFTDFIACAEHLIEQGYTSTPKIAIEGRSAGGLLAGACLTMRPDLFKAVVATVPFVDVITTMSDPTIPLTTLEYNQWGNPDDKEYFDYMMSYSPYDNIKAIPYPDVLITTGMNDPRVAFWEPAKLAARLRATATGDGLLLLKTHMESGHAGASGRYDALKEVALTYAFLIDRLGA